MRPTLPRLIALAVAVSTAALYVLLGYQQWTTGWVPSWDLGIFSQLAKAYASLGAPIVPIKGEGFNLLGDHFHPILVLLGPIWALWPSPLSLLVTQAVLFGVSAYPLTRFAAERFGATFGAVLGLAYGLSWGLQSAAASQFHEIAFAVVMLAFGLVAYLEQRWTSAAVWIGLLVFVKEDMGLTIAVFAAVLWWTQRSQRRLALGLGAWGIGWLLASTLIILPALNPKQQYDYTDRLTGIGASLSSSDTYVMLLMLVATFGVVGLRSPLALLTVPTLAWRLAGNVSFYWGWEWHYSATLMTIAFAALLDWLVRDEPRSNVPLRVRWLALLLALAATLSVWTKMPLLRLTNDDYWNPWREPGLAGVLASVPNGASVLTDLGAMAYLVPDHTVYWLGSSHPVPDYIVRNDYSNAWDATARANLASWASAHFGVPYQEKYRADGFQVVARVR